MSRVASLTISKARSGDPDPSSNEYGLPDRLVAIATAFGQTPCPSNYATLKDEIARYEGKIWRRAVDRRTVRLERESTRLDLENVRLRLENDRLRKAAERS